VGPGGEGVAKFGVAVGWFWLVSWGVEFASSIAGVADLVGAASKISPASTGTALGAKD